MSWTDMDVEARRRWISVLAQAPWEQLEAAWERLGPREVARWVRPAGDSIWAR